MKPLLCAFEACSGCNCGRGPCNHDRGTCSYDRGLCKLKERKEKNRKEKSPKIAGGIVADDWTSIHWKKIDYLISCGLRPWYLDNTDPGASPSCAPHSNFAPTPTPNHITPQAPHVLAQQQQQQQQQPAGQQQAWAYPVQTSGQNVQLNQSQPGQQWQCAASGGAAAGSGVQAVVKVGQPWQSSPGRWQCDVNITLMNKGVLLLFAVCDSSAMEGSNCFLQQCI